MKKIVLFVALLLSMVGNAAAQSSRATQRFTSTGTSTGVILSGSGTTFNQLVWNTFGTVSSCTVALDSSADGTTWTAGGAIVGQTCTSTGSTAVTSGTFNYVRINVTAFAGSGSVLVTALGFVTSGGGGGTPGGGSSSVQFNNSGAFGGDATNFSYDNTQHNLLLTGTVTGSGLVSTGNVAGALTLNELPANGSTFVRILSPDLVLNSVAWKWPAADGTFGQSATTDGAGNLNFLSNLNAPGVVSRRETVCGPNSSSPTYSCYLTGDAVTATGTINLTPPSAGVPSFIFQSTGAVANTTTGVSASNSMHFLGRTHGLRYRWLAKSNPITGVRFFGCVTDTTLALLADNAGVHDSKAQGNYACIWFDSSGAYQTPPANSTTHFVCLTDNNVIANQQAVDSGVVADNGWHWFEVFENSATNYLFYIDGTQVCSLSGTGLPTTNTAVRWANGGENLTTTSITFGIAGHWVSEDWK